jgi:hypothetical protein
MKYGLNKINSRLFEQQVGWLGGKGVQFYLWGPRIKLPKRLSVFNDWFVMTLGLLVIFILYD